MTTNTHVHQAALARARAIDKYEGVTSQDWYLRYHSLHLPQEVQEEIKHHLTYGMGHINAIQEAQETQKFLVYCGDGQHVVLEALVKYVRLQAVIDAWIAHCEAAS